MNDDLKDLDREALIAEVVRLRARQLPDAARSEAKARSLQGRVRTAPLGALAVGAAALGACALGAVAIGALAIGRIAIGGLTVKRARANAITVDELTIGRLHILEP